MTANTKQIVLTFAVSIALVAGLAWWLEQRSSTPELILDPEQEIVGPLTAEEQRVVNPGVANEANPVVTLRTNQGDITLELFADQMPVTVNNFLQYATADDYDGTIFHRVIENFMIQGGDLSTRADGGPDGGAKTIQDEFVTGELLTNTRGTIAMANTGQPNSGSSQWFINLKDNTNLDFDKESLSAKHPVFGRVIEGMDVVDKIAAVPKKRNARGELAVPEDPVVIEDVLYAQ